MGRLAPLTPAIFIRKRPRRAVECSRGGMRSPSAFGVTLSVNVLDVYGSPWGSEQSQKQAFCTMPEKRRRLQNLQR
jgi:hypothetical protein